MEPSSESLQQQIQAAQLQRLQLEIDQLEAEKRLRDQQKLAAVAEANRPWYDKLNYLQIGTTILVILPVVWFYLTEVIYPSLETANIQAELETAKLEQELNELSTNISRERLEFQTQQDSMFEATSRRTEDYRQRMQALEDVKVNSLRILDQMEEENNKRQLQAYAGQLRGLWSGFEAGNPTAFSQIEQALRDITRAYIDRQRKGTATDLPQSSSGITVMGSGLENVVFPKLSNPTTEQVTFRYIVDGTEELYSVLVHVEVLMREEADAKEKKLRPIPEDISYQVALAQFQETFLAYVQEALPEKLAGTLAVDVQGI